MRIADPASPAPMPKHAKKAESDSSVLRASLEESKESAAKYRGLLEAAPDAMVVVDGAGEIVLLNLQAEKQFGYSRDELVGQKVTNIIPEGFAERLIADGLRSTEAALAHVMGSGIELVARRKDGSEFPIEIMLSLLRGDEGILVTAAIRDISVRKAAEGELRESEDRFRYSFEHSIVAKSMTLPSGQMDVNDAFLAMIGYTRAEMAEAATWQQISHPDDIARTNEVVASMLSGECDSARFEKRYLHKNGSVIWADVSTSLRRGSDGLPRYFMTSVLDITERRRVQEELRASNESLRQFFDADIIGTLVARPDGTIVEANDYFLRLIGRTREQFDRGEIDWRSITPPEQVQLTERSIGDMQAIGRGKTYEKEYMRPDGTRVQTLVTAGAMPGTTDQGAAFVVDISDRKHAEQELRILEQAMQSQTSGFVLTDLQGILTRVNPAFLRLWGYAAPEEILGRSALEFVQRPDEVAKALRIVGSSGAWTGEIEAKRRDGSSFPTQVTASLVNGDDGQPLCTTALFEDNTERKRAAELVQTAREHLEEAQRLVHLGSWDWDPVLDEISGSAEFFRLFDAVPEEILRYAQFAERLHPADRERVDRDVAEALAANRPYDTEYRVRLRDGGWRDINALGQVVTDPDGKPVRFVGTCLDITERKRAEEALVQSERWYRTLAEHLPHLVWTTRADGPCDYLSPRWVDYTGIPESEQLGYRWLEQLHPDDRDRVITEWTAAASSGESFDIAFRIRRADGAYRWFETRAIPFCDTDGRVVKWFGSNTDVDDAKRAEQELRAAHARLRRFVDSAVVGFTVARADGSILEANDYYLDVVGYARQDLERGEIDWRTLTPAEWLPADERGLADVLERGVCTPYEKEYLRRDGSRIPVILAYAALPDSTDLAVFVLDISERKSAEDRLRQASEELAALNAELEERVTARTAELEAANRELEAFSYSVSHDLRAPLRSVDGFSKILLQDHGEQLDAEARRVLGVVVRNVGQMGRLIDDLLAFSRVSRKELERQPVDMDRLARSVSEELRAAEPERAIEVDIGPLGGTLGDPGLLRQVWANLLGNAFKFTRPAGRPRIEVSSEQVDGDCRYTVNDNGVGFDPAYADNLFKPFQRLHPTAEFEGTGIGLAIVARIVLRHGGRVWAEGEPGAGATFGFSLPTGKEEK
jgi:PAS domain S-box-containing protein